MTRPPLPPSLGGPGWRPRPTTLRDELGSVWGPCGIDSEWRPLISVLLHRPGRELEALPDPPLDSLMLGALDPGAVTREHDTLAQAFRSQGVEVQYVQPITLPPPNQMFCADLFAMTPEGAIVGRPASAVRAGEERWVSEALADAGVPLLRSIRGTGTFEGADLMWLTPERTLLGQGLRTNEQGAGQVRAILREMGISTHTTLLPPGSMHLMGLLRIVDSNLALVWKGRLGEDALETLRSSGYEVAFLPDEGEAREGFALNFVVLEPRKILMPGGNPVTRTFYESLGITCLTVQMQDTARAAGSIGCLTGILEREKSPDA